MTSALIKNSGRTYEWEEHNVWVPGTPAVPASAPIPSTPGSYVDVVAREPIVILVPGAPQTAGVTGALVPFIVGYREVVRRVYLPGTGGSPGYPGAPAIPGHFITERRRVVRLTLNEGWTGGARSIGVLDGDGRLDCFIGPGSAGVVVGLNNRDQNAGYTEISHGFYVWSGAWMVVERGTTHLDGVYVDGDQLTVQRVGTQITYAINGVVVYRSQEPCVGPVFADASLYLAGDAIVNATLDGAVDPALAATSGGSNGLLSGLVGFAQQGTGSAGYLRNPALGPLVGVAQSYPTGAVAGRLPGLVGEINGTAYPGRNYASCRGLLATGIVTTAMGQSGGLRPNVAVATAMLTPLTGFAIGLGGQCADGAGVLAGVCGYAANVDTAQCLGALPSLTGRSFDGQRIDNFALVTLPQPTLFALGHANYGVRIGARLTLPRLTLEAYGAGQARLTLPTPALTASGTVTNSGTARLRLPLLQLTMAATVANVGRLAATIKPGLAVTAYGGGTAVLLLPRLGVTATGVVGAVGYARLVMAQPQLQASGVVGDVVRVGGTLGGLVMPGMGVFMGTLPRLWLRAVGGAASAATYEGYSITLLTDDQGNPAPAVTHYTTFPFDRIVRFGRRYFGVATDGLYELGGATYNGAPIVAVVETAESDLGAPELKHPRALYLGGRMGADLTVTVKSAELERDEYTYTPVAAGARTRRVLFGRGIRARYFAFGFSNYDGDDFQVDEIRPEVEVVRRRV